MGIRIEEADTDGRVNQPDPHRSQRGRTEIDVVKDEENWKQLHFESPDRQHILTLTWQSEIRFGPAYYRARLDDREIASRVFGRQCSWSPDSRYLALELWNSTSASEGPDTSLFLIRLHDLRSYDRPRIRHGFLGDVEFTSTAVRYCKDRSRSLGTREHCELELGSISNWSPLH